MEKYYENLIKESKTKQELMELGLRTLISKNAESISMNHLKVYVDILEKEKEAQVAYEQQLNDIISGEFEKRERAKKLLGIGE